MAIHRQFSVAIDNAVVQLDLSAFCAAYRADEHGRAAHDPAMMVALLLYGYALGERSSRRLERRCVEDAASRVICANQAPDHATIARFRQRHEAAAANAAPQATRDYAQIAREILASLPTHRMSR